MDVMRGIVLTISATDISDLHALGATAAIPDLINAAREVITKGGTVAIEQRFASALPQVIVRFRSLSEIDRWEHKINDFLNKSTG